MSKTIEVSIEVIEGLPIKKIDDYMDFIVQETARITLDFTNTKNRFPELTGDLKRSSMARGVVSEGNKTYSLGTDDTVDYGGYVWKFPQDTNWTNEETYAQWFVTEFKNEKEIIMSNAIQNAKRKFK